MNQSPDEPEGAVGPDDEPADDRSRRRSEHTPWTRILLAAAIGIPSLAFGGVHPTTVVAWVVLVTILWVRLCLRSRAPLVVPLWAGLGLLLVGATLVQWLPLAGIRGALSPTVDGLVEAALTGTGVQPRAGLSPTPADTALEAARLAGLTALFVAASQLSWRVSATVVAGVGTLVALIGFAHEALGFDAIYGTYAARDVDRGAVPALLGSFVNPNHQSGLLLLGVFCGIALAADQHAHGLVTADPGRVDRYSDRFLAAMAGVTIQVPALVLSLSRAALLLLLVLGPIAAWLAMRHQRSGRRARRRRAERMSPARLMVIFGAIGLFVIVIQHGAWAELATLSKLADSGSEAQHKLIEVGQAMALLGDAPTLGIGRGAFVDLFPAIRDPPTHVLATHLECAPAVAVLEWGPWIGGTFVIGAVAYWLLAMFRGGRTDANARRVVLLGLLALAIQNTVDFAFEFLGVASPAVALAGGLAAGPLRRIPSRLAMLAGGALLLGAIALASVGRDQAQLRREDVNAEILAGRLDGTAALRLRPLDGRLHGLLARKAARVGDWETTRARASVATDLRPGDVDPWLLRGTALRQLGSLTAGDAAMARGLGALHEAPDPALVQWLLREYPTPASLTPLTPESSTAWRLLVDALVRVAPRHADAIAAARSRVHPSDPEPLRIRHALALHEHNAALALHHARLLHQVEPQSPAARIAMARAFRAFDPPRRDEALAAIERALADEAFADLAELGLLEQELVEILIDIGDAPALERADTVVRQLLTRPASRDARRERDRIARSLRGR